MNLSTNARKGCFPLYQLAAHDFEAGGQVQSLGSTKPMQTESQDCIISFRRKPYDQPEEAKFNSWKGNWHWDVRTDTTVWSEPLYRMIGRQNATIPPFTEQFCFYTSESWIRLVDATSRLLRTGTPYELTLQMLHSDGGRRWVIRSGEAVRNEHGHILEVRGTVQDVSEWMIQLGNSAGDLRARSNADTSGRLIQAQEDENAKLAIELRDNICQRVSLLAVEIQNFRSTLPDLPPQAETQLELFWQQTTQVLVELDRISDRLHPVVVDLLGLASAMECLCREFAREHGIPVDYRCSEVPANRLDKQCELVLYRVLEEILANVARHSGANNVMVGLDHDTEELRLRVSDNGVGFDQAKANTAVGLGFGRMKAQISQIEGSLAVWSKHACGTLIEVEVPLEHSKRRNAS